MVSAVVKAAPEVAGPVTLAASEMEAGQAGYIASAAISSAPSAKNEIVTSVNRGVSLAPGGSATLTPARTFTPRGAAAAPATATVTQSNTPINTSTGGNHNGSFSGATATPAGNPAIIDYTGPRS
jgi:hypothetical protein